MENNYGSTLAIVSLLIGILGFFLVTRRGAFTKKLFITIDDKGIQTENNPLMPWSEIIRAEEFPAGSGRNGRIYVFIKFHLKDNTVTKNFKYRNYIQDYCGGALISDMSFLSKKDRELLRKEVNKYIKLEKGSWLFIPG